ncbi:uncharacterized protein VICG_01098 [Vittaforma corneae ATCC 50505]|uniref:Uncharacterized protein n=1 Tax=Vittaforma corneae (strain ATCC 50505) TaxID=993615 RepID=L2GMP7_VITCO|nr:uncharacterized protein VICG_01098 [Vittaforma corneae ATCC 50505]ELA41914.1 hypothetical protein VICG_01098 [Vittaforma corneae ATCC 50505]
MNICSRSTVLLIVSAIISSVACVLSPDEQLSLDLDAFDSENFEDVVEHHSDETFHQVIASKSCNEHLDNITRLCTQLEQCIETMNKSQKIHFPALLLENVQNLTSLCRKVCEQVGIQRLNYKRECTTKHYNFSLLKFAEMLFDVREYIEAQVTISKNIHSRINNKSIEMPPKFTNKSDTFSECTGGKAIFREFMTTFYLHLLGLSRCLESRVGPDYSKENVSPVTEPENTRF